MKSGNRSSAQKQFNERVKENICELGMDEDEAVELAVEQLVSQEVSLADIIPDVWVVKGEDPINVFCDKYNQIPLATMIGSGFNVRECLEKMKCATEMANQRRNYKLYAVDRMMDVIILSLARMKNADQKIIRACLECLGQLYSGCPELMKEETVEWLLEIYGESNGTIKCAILSLLKDGCAAHENNKRMLFSKTDLIATLRVIIESRSVDTLAPALGIICNFSKDDDDTCQNSDALQRAADLAEGILSKLYEMVKHSQPTKIRKLLLETLVFLTVTDHLAQEVFCHDDKFSIIKDLLNGTIEDDDILVSILKFLNEVCRLEEAKSAMKPLIHLIVSKIDNFSNSTQVSHTGFLFLSVLSLNNKDNATTLVECNAADIILQGMKAHQNSMVLENGFLALQNMASSSRHLHPLCKLAVAEFINEVMAYERNSTIVDLCNNVLESLKAHPE